MVIIPSWLMLTIIFISLLIAFFYLITFLETRNNKEEKIIKKFPLITFIIPAYNAAVHIEKTIYSVLRSDYPKSKLRILVVNDGSTDDTADVVKKLIRKYSRIKLFTKKKEGKAAALNYGIKKAKTELIAVLDADTLLQQDLLKKSIALLSASHIMAVTSRLVPLNEEGFFPRMQVVEYALASFFRKLMSRINALPIAPAFTIYKASFFKKHGDFDVGNLTEDFEMALRINSHGYKVVYVLDSYAKTVVPSRFRQLYRQRVRWGYGTLFNLKKYKHMFSLEYGELGTFVLPALIIGMFIIVFTFIFAIYNIFVGISQSVRHIMLGWLPAFNINLFGFLIMLSDPRIILGAVGLIISFTFLFLMKKETKADISIIDYIVYVMAYIWMLAYFRVASIIRFFSKKPSW